MYIDDLLCNKAFHATKTTPTSSESQDLIEQIPVAGGDGPHALVQDQSAFFELTFG
jgi:hypothetical protein